jgi:hypothetical protein
LHYHWCLRQRTVASRKTLKHKAIVIDSCSPCGRVKDDDEDGRLWVLKQDWWFELLCRLRAGHCNSAEKTKWGFWEHREVDVDGRWQKGVAWIHISWQPNQIAHVRCLSSCVNGLVWWYHSSETRDDR